MAPAARAAPQLFAELFPSRCPARERRAAGEVTRRGRIGRPHEPYVASTRPPDPSGACDESLGPASHAAVVARPRRERPRPALASRASRRYTARRFAPAVAGIRVADRRPERRGAGAMGRSQEFAITGARVVLAAFALAYGAIAVFGEHPVIATDATTSLSESSARALAGLMAIAGFCLLLGVLARAASVTVLAIVVWHAIAHGRFEAYFERENGCERVLAIAALAFVVITHGAGALRVDLNRRSKSD
jgi:uncharacterized membrane protein YphA (DoxX/SURF4 family)